MSKQKKNTRTSISITTEVHDRISALAVLKGVTVNEVVAELLDLPSVKSEIEVAMKAREAMEAARKKVIERHNKTGE